MVDNTISAAANRLTGEDLAAIGIASSPVARGFAAPTYKLKTKQESMTINWCGRPQNIHTATTYALAHRSEAGKLTYIHGAKITFFREELDPDVRVVNVETEKDKVQQHEASADEVREILVLAKPEVGEMILDSILVDFRRINQYPDWSSQADMVRREVLTVLPLKDHAISEIECYEAEGSGIQGADETWTPSEDEPVTGSPTSSTTGMPDWPTGDETVSISDEVLNPPTAEDRPVLVQFQVSDGAGNSVVRTHIADCKKHLQYWTRMVEHASQDIVRVAPISDGFEALCSLKLNSVAGTDSAERFQWLHNKLSLLKIQVLQGSPQRRDGTRAIEGVQGIQITGIRVAYP